MTSSSRHEQSASNNVINRILTPPQVEELKKLYVSSAELLRHFWSCFPANTPFLQEKVSELVSFPALQRAAIDYAFMLFIYFPVSRKQFCNKSQSIHTQDF